jgi:methenyltetrahydrofolate cyclohydrolase
VESESIGGWLEALASSAPAPGGGAAAALEAAMGAALIEMFCNLTIGKPTYAEHEELMEAARDRAQVLRADAIGLAAEDAAAFRAVIDAYKLSKEDAGRHHAIQAALAVAADVPRRTAGVASEVLDLAERVAPVGNVNVVSDAAAAAASARAALQIALLNIDANTASIEDPALLSALGAITAEIGRDLARADEIVASVRERASG